MGVNLPLIKFRLYWKFTDISMIFEMIFYQRDIITVTDGVKREMVNTLGRWRGIKNMRPKNLCKKGTYQNAMVKRISLSNYLLRIYHMHASLILFVCFMSFLSFFKLKIRTFMKVFWWKKFFAQLFFPLSKL